MWHFVLLRVRFCNFSQYLLMEGHFELSKFWGCWKPGQLKAKKAALGVASTRCPGPAFLWFCALHLARVVLFRAGAYLLMVTKQIEGVWWEYAFVLCKQLPTTNHSDLPALRFSTAALRPCGPTSHGCQGSQDSSAVAAAHVGKALLLVGSPAVIRPPLCT